MQAEAVCADAERSEGRPERWRGLARTLTCRTWRVARGAKEDVKRCVFVLVVSDAALSDTCVLLSCPHQSKWLLLFLQFSSHCCSKSRLPTLLISCVHSYLQASCQSLSAKSKASERCNMSVCGDSCVMQAMSVFCGMHTTRRTQTRFATVFKMNHHPPLIPPSLFVSKAKCVFSQF